MLDIENMYFLKNCVTIMHMRSFAKIVSHGYLDENDGNSVVFEL